jgi:D-serine deaminase-like pyridoxal phosphate-dependent protein
LAPAQGQIHLKELGMTDFPPDHPALLDLAPYRIDELSETLTPALAIYPKLVDRNIETTLRLFSGDPARWRPHIKTAKLSAVHRRLIAHGVTRLKCATSLELLTACADGATDVLLSFPVMGANARRVRQIAEQYPDVRVSALVESVDQLDVWGGGRVGVFIDVNPGMNRTGISQGDEEGILALARAAVDAGLEFRGLHYYQGHLTTLNIAERERAVHAGYDRLLELVSSLERAGLPVEEIITAGTPAFPCTLAYKPFAKGVVRHSASPGTIVYTDATTLMQLPREFGYVPAALVLATVVSHPSPSRVTADAGHKAIAADMGNPTCAVVGWPELRGAQLSEEHLPLDARDGADLPALGETLYLVPRHVCPTVNNFDFALMVEGGRITSVERVTARGHEGPLPSQLAK